MRIDPRLAILSVLVVALVVFGISSATPAFAAATKSKHVDFKAAQTKAHRILTGTAKTNPVRCCAGSTDQFSRKPAHCLLQRLCSGLEWTGLHMVHTGTAVQRKSRPIQRCSRVMASTGRPGSHGSATEAGVSAITPGSQ